MPGGEAPSYTSPTYWGKALRTGKIGGLFIFALFSSATDELLRLVWYF